MDSIAGTALDTGGSAVAETEVSLYDGADYYNPGSGDFDSSSPVWLSATGTTVWSLDAAAVPWSYGVVYSVQSRAKDTVGNIEIPVSASTFTVIGNPPPKVVPPKKSKGGCALAPDASPWQALGWGLAYGFAFGLALLMRRRRMARYRDVAGR
jgi:hypothetical protein